MNQKYLLAAAIALCVGIFVGFFLGKRSGAPDQSIRIQKLQSQLEQAKKFFPSLPQNTRSVSGIVKEVRASAIVLETIPAGPFDESPRMRTITIGKDAKIVKNEQKDPAAYQREIAEFQKTVQEQSGKPGLTPVMPPPPFREVAAKISDIKPGQQVSITADENIRDKESFEATQVTILGLTGIPGGNMPSPAPPPLR